jgi:uncharacterized protein (DUF58 family)
MSKSPPTPNQATPERLTSETILRRLEWTVLRRLDGVLHGDYRTLFRGFGLDLAGLREYQMHDDVRHIDWNTTARLQQPYVRQYNEDREVTAWFLLDLSPSIDFGSEDVRKRNVLIDFVGVISRLLTRHGNRVGVLFYSGAKGRAIEGMIPARAGRQHVLHILNALRARPELPRAPETNLAEFLKAAGQIVQRRSLVFVVSDFISAPGWTEALAQIVMRHEVLAVRLFDQLEMELPDLGLLVMQDAETGEQIFVDTTDRGFRKRFAAMAEKRELDLRESFGKAGVDALELSTGDDLVDVILRFADLRKRRSQVAAGGGMPQHIKATSTGFPA